MEEAALTGNPLLNSSSSAASSGRMKRKWNDDIVFRNQARGEPDQNKKRFINDTVRNDFHKRFLNKVRKSGISWVAETHLNLNITAQFIK